MASIIQEYNVRGNFKSLFYSFQSLCSMLHFVLNFQLLRKLWIVYSSTAFSRKSETFHTKLKIIKDKHQSFKQEIRFGKKGKTAQFWMSYLDNITFMLTFNRIVLKLA